MTDLHSPRKDRLFQAILTLESIEDCYNFFEDICTIKEVMDMTQRFETAERLANGENYQQISTDVGVSPATISRVNRCLRYGAGGYRKALELLKDADQQK